MKFPCTASGTQRVVNRRLWGLGGYGESHVGCFRDPRVMSDVAAALGARVEGGSNRPGPGWLRRRTMALAVPLLLLAVVLVGAGLMAAFFYAVAWISGTVMAWMVGLVWPAAEPRVGHAWMVAVGWWAVWAWLVFTARDGCRRSRTRHERRWR